MLLKLELPGVIKFSPKKALLLAVEGPAVFSSMVVARAAGSAHKHKMETLQAKRAIDPERKRFFTVMGVGLDSAALQILILQKLTECQRCCVSHRKVQLLAATRQETC